MRNDILIGDKRRATRVSWQPSSRICFLVHVKLISLASPIVPPARRRAREDTSASVTDRNDVRLASRPRNFRHHRPHVETSRTRSARIASPWLSRRLLFRRRLSARMLGEESFERENELAEKPKRQASLHVSREYMSCFTCRENATIILTSLSQY